MELRKPPWLGDSSAGGVWSRTGPNSQSDEPIAITADGSAVDRLTQILCRQSLTTPYRFGPLSDDQVMRARRQVGCGALHEIVHEGKTIGYIDPLHPDYEGLGQALGLVPEPVDEKSLMAACKLLGVEMKSGPSKDCLVVHGNHTINKYKYLGDGLYRLQKE